MTDDMDTLVSSSPIQTYMDNSHKMRVSNDADTSDPKDLCSLGVVDLDLSLSPDAFGLRAFDSTKPLTRMLPGSFPCQREFRLILPDLKIVMDGFHDVIIENLAASPTWRSRHISPGDVTALRRRWSNAVFKTMQRRSKEVERLHRLARCRPEWTFRQTEPGFCSICQEEIASALNVHMINCHLELGQLWWCLVEWCAVWKGSMRDCLGHLQDKHGGSQYVALQNVAKFFPPWTVPRDLWHTALRLEVSVLPWMPDCSTRPGVGWYTSTVSTRIHFHIRCSGGGGGGCFLDCRLWVGLWPLPSSHSYTFPFLCRERPRGRYQKNVFRTARLPGD